MTIKEFARLCACNTQTLRYYDKIDLLKPVKVDPWSGYRYYEPAQALDFVRIKNLQFSIGEIKCLLNKSDQEVYAAFGEKIAEQVHKLERIREIQKSYLAEKNIMEQILYSMTDFILSQCSHPEVLSEFGLPVSDAPAVLQRLRVFFNTLAAQTALGTGKVSLAVNGELVHGQEAVLERIHSLSKANVGDTIQLNHGYGVSIQLTTERDPHYDDYDAIWQRHGWQHISDFLDELPRLEQGKQYCLRVQMVEKPYSDDLSFAMFFLGTVLLKQQLDDTIVSCSTTTSEDGTNRFSLLRKRQSQ